MTLYDAITPDWPPVPSITAFTTTRQHGVSCAPYHACNLALHVGDDPTAVETNRRQLQAAYPQARTPVWLNQTHSDTVIRVDNPPDTPPKADACITDQIGLPCAVLTADCLPILIAATDGSEVAAIHAGWQGLITHIITKTIHAMHTPPTHLQAWIGPAISATHYEVTAPWINTIKQIDTRYQDAIITQDNLYYADLIYIARLQLQDLGMPSYGGTLCTYSNPDTFYSYRYQNQTGRQASIIMKTSL